MRYRRWAYWVTSMLGLQLALVGIAYTQTETANEPQEREAAAEKASPVDPTGTWKWEYTFNDNTAEFELKLDWDGKKLTGKYTAFDRTSEIEDAKLEKDQLSFVVKREFNGEEFVVNFAGQAELDEINGTVEFEMQGEPREFDWNAKRSVEIDDVLGTWDLKVESPNGVIEPKLTISKDGERLRGKSMTESFGELEAKNVTLKDNELSWEVTGATGGVEIHVKYKGKPRGNTIAGTNEFSVGGNTGTMKFTGKRTPPEEEKEKPASEAKPAAEATPAAAATEAK
jgi:hypothetical protein